MSPTGCRSPAELERREARLAAIAEATVNVAARVAEREQADSQAKLAARAEKARRTGQKPGGPPPAPPSGGVDAQEQINLTDDESRIMPVAGGGFEQCCNAQAMVAAESLSVLAPEVTQAATDQAQLLPMIEKLKAPPQALGRTAPILADSGYASGKNVEACTAAGIEPLIALRRERHHPTWRQRFAPAPGRRRTGQARWTRCGIG